MEPCAITPALSSARCEAGGGGSGTGGDHVGGGLTPAAPHRCAVSPARPFPAARLRHRRNGLSAAPPLPRLPIGLDRSKRGGHGALCSAQHLDLLAYLDGLERPDWARRHALSLFRSLHPLAPPPAGRLLSASGREGPLLRRGHSAPAVPPPPPQRQRRKPGVECVARDTRTSAVVLIAGFTTSLFFSL